MRRLELSDSELASLVSEVVGLGLPLRVFATGSSMGRSLPAGSRPVLVGAHELAVGDVALCRVGPRILLHRVRAISGAGVWVQGDALPRPDGWVPWRNVLAKVAYRVPRRRSWRALARNLWRRAWHA